MNMKKILCRILPIVVCLILVGFNVFGTSEGISYDIKMPTDGQAVGQVETAGKKIWGIVELVVQVLAVAAVVFAGLRYMLASADTKADIKKQCIILALGAALIFAATNILKIVASVTNEVLS